MITNYIFQTKKYSNENDNINVIYTKQNDSKYMFMGDALVTIEKEMLKSYNLLDIYWSVVFEINNNKLKIEMFTK